MNRYWKSLSSSWLATGTSLSTKPSPSSQASQLLHKKKNCSPVSTLRIIISDKNHEGSGPVLSCQIRIYCKEPREYTVVTRYESCDVLLKDTEDVLCNKRGSLSPLSPVIIMEGSAVEPAFRRLPVNRVTSYLWLSYGSLSAAQWSVVCRKVIKNVLQ